MDYDWLDNIYHICAREPLRRKIILCDRLQQGEQWLSRMVREQGPLLGVEIETIHTLVLKQSRHECASRGLKPLHPSQFYWVVQSLMNGMASHHADYVPKGLVTPGIVRSFQKTIEELRCAQISGSKLQAAQFESEAKRNYLIDLLDRYERWLDANRAIDFAGLLPFLSSSTDDCLYIIQEIDHLTAVEKEMLRRIAGDHRLTVVRSERRFPDSLTPSSARFYRAASPLAEARESLRRVIADRIPFDQVELMLSGDESGHHAFLALTHSLEIPCTFSNGLPLVYSKAGRAAIAYLDWLEQDYQVERMLEPLRHGVVRLAGQADGLTTAELIRTLERAGIGWSSTRYELLQVADGVAADSDLSDSGDGGDARARAVLHATFKRLLSGLPQTVSGWSPLAVLSGLTDFIARHTVPSDDLDIQVRAAFEEQLQQLQGIAGEEVSREEAIRCVRDIAASMKIACEGPAAGKLHVSTLSDGGESGRPHLNILGMSESAWRVQPLQDAVLLDTERSLIGDLPLSGERADRSIRERLSRLGRTAGVVTMSYASYEPVDQKEVHPAYELLQAARAIHGEPDMDLTGLQRVLGGPVEYMDVYPSDRAGEAALNGADLWLSRLAGDGKLRDGLHSLAEAYPWMNGWQLQIAHQSAGAWSEYEGVIQPGEYAVLYRGEAGTVISATMLEKYAECPRKFFFLSVLRVKDKETAVFDRSQWLSAADRGSLLHCVYDLYMREITRDGTSEDRPAHDLASLEAITESVASEFASRIPPPSAAIFRKEYEAIRADTAVFFKTELEREGRPRYFELDLTSGDEPMEVVLEGGLCFRIRGFVDRVDEIGPHTYKIYDYKTGSPAKYDEHAYFSQGTQLQHALYAVAVEQWLRESGRDPGARVTESAYYFPTERGRGEEVSRVQNRRTELAELVGHLLDGIEAGEFAPTGDVKKCEWCDYRSACGRAAERSEARRTNTGSSSRIPHLTEVERYA